MKDRASWTWFGISCAFFVLLCLPSIALVEPSIVWDDSFYLERFAKTPWLALLGPFDFNKNYWRPLGTASMMFPFFWKESLGGMPNALWVSKIISFAIFAVGAFAALASVKASSTVSGNGKRVAMLCAAALLALSPVFAEITMWWSARFDLLLTVFVVLMMWRQDKQKKHPLLEGLLWGACLGLSKETGIGLALFLGGAFALGQKDARWGKGLLLSAGLMLAVRYLVIKNVPFDLAPTLGMDLDEPPRGGLAIVMTVLESLGRQALLLAMPGWDSNPIHTEGWGGAPVKALGLALLIGAQLVLNRLAAQIKNKTQSRDTVWACAALMLCVFHGGAANLFRMSGETVWSVASGRYLAPSAMIFLILACKKIEVESKNLNKLVGAAVLSALLFSVQNAREARLVWSDNLNLWSAVVNRGPETTMGVSNLANEYYNTGRFDEAYLLSEKWVLKSSNLTTMCRLWWIIEQNKNAVPSVKKLVRHRRISRLPCVEAWGLFSDKAF